MVQCCAYGCTTVGTHLFPKDDARRKQWEIALKRDGFKSTKYSRLCAAHFKPEDYIYESFFTGIASKRKILKKTAVPSLFCFKKQPLPSIAAREARVKKRASRCLDFSVKRQKRVKDATVQVLDDVPDPCAEVENPIALATMRTSQCRVCLSENDCVCNIFTDKCSNSQSYAEVLMNCFIGVPVVKNDSMPSHICKSCISSLETWAACGVIDDRFISKYSSSNRLLKNMSIKVEPEFKEYSQIQQIETRIAVCADIETEEISLKTEPDNEYFQNNFDEQETDSLETKAFGEEVDDKKHQPEDLKTDTEKKIYDCAHCTKIFGSKAALGRHLRTITGEKPFKCDHCDKAFSLKYYLAQHLRTHTGEKPFNCKHCEKEFSLKNHLVRHLRTHTGEKPYECDHCGKAFGDKTALMRHIMTHAGERPYKCDRCKKAFRAKGYLTLHLRMHTGENPLKCDYCERKFDDRTSLRRHLRTHTGEKPFKCHHCEKAFSLNASLIRHLWTHTIVQPDNLDVSISANQVYEDNFPRTDWKYDNSSFDCTSMIFKTADIKTEEICLKTEPDDEYFRTDLEENDMCHLDMKPLV